MQATGARIGYKDVGEAIVDFAEVVEVEDLPPVILELHVRLVELNELLDLACVPVPLLESVGRLDPDLVARLKTSRQKACNDVFLPKAWSLQGPLDR